MSTIFTPGEDFPRSRSELEEWVVTEDDCREFLVFLSNRRGAHHRGHLFYRLLECAVQTPPATYDGITS